MYEEQKVEIIESCHALVADSSFIGTWGNVSERVGDHIILTPSRVSYGTMRVEDMVVIGLDGEIVESPAGHVPTSEKEVHRQIYLVRDDVRAVVHAHTANAMAVSTLPEPEVPCLVEEMSQLLGGSIPLTERYVPAEHHQELGLAAAQVVGDRNAVIMRNHGPVACGRTMEEARLAVKVIEKSCGIYLSVLGRAYKPIPQEYVESERYRFLYKYGKEKS